jgi:hypothetical protein
VRISLWRVSIQILWRVEGLSLSEPKSLFNGRNVVMYFDARKALNQPPSTKLQTAPAKNERAGGTIDIPSAAPMGPAPQIRDWKAANMLDSANNKLQELMQLLYLLSRDPDVPKDARYHVTVAQGEIALLAQVMRNSTPPEGGEPPAGREASSADDQAHRTAHP